MPRPSRADSPWRRLPWLLPAALLLSLAGIAGFLALLGGKPLPPKSPPPIELQLVALPPAAPEPPQAEPAPPPEPEVMLEPPPEPPPPPPLPPPPRPPSPWPAPMPPRPVRPPPVAAAPAPPPRVPVPPAPVPPGGGRSAARAIYRPLPEIPDALRRRAIDLVAVARFRIAASGAAEVELVEATPDPTLNRALLDTLKTWRFFPALVEGKPQASVLDIRIPLVVR